MFREFREVREMQEVQENNHRLLENSPLLQMLIQQNEEMVRETEEDILQFETKSDERQARELLEGLKRSARFLKHKS